MLSSHRIDDTSNIFTPALLFYKDLIRHNIRQCLELAGSSDRLRPHCKTHKTREITSLLLGAGITKHKCATLAEAELLAGCGVRDVVLAYPMVGPNCGRLAALMAHYPECRFTVLADHPVAARALSQVMRQEGRTVRVLLDIDMGQHRTGIPAGAAAVDLYRLLSTLPGLEPRGFHLYDGHNHQDLYADRESAVHEQLEPVQALRVELERQGLPVPTLLAGGTPTFPVFAGLNLPGLECSPGTCILQDNGYGTHFPDMAQFLPAALLLTRVISKPTPTRVTFDLGYKAVASDPPAGQRLVLLDLPEYQFALQNEEHLAIDIETADELQPGDVVYAVPTHVCPTCAMHQFAYVVEGGRVADKWEIVGRNRVLTV
jgi:D-serine deaminase-like pyridoxal phosphate-dependent protein